MQEATFDQRPLVHRMSITVSAHCIWDEEAARGAAPATPGECLPGVCPAHYFCATCGCVSPGFCPAPDKPPEVNPNQPQTLSYRAQKTKPVNSLCTTMTCVVLEKHFYQDVPGALVAKVARSAINPPPKREQSVQYRLHASISDA